VTEKLGPAIQEAYESTQTGLKRQVRAAAATRTARGPALCYSSGGGKLPHKTSAAAPFRFLPHCGCILACIPALRAAGSSPRLQAGHAMLPLFGPTHRP
jgi:hypothetical protein